MVLFDGSDSGLDPVRCALLCELVRDVHDENRWTYVVFTHAMLSARRIAEHSIFVRESLNGETSRQLGMD